MYQRREIDYRMAMVEAIQAGPAHFSKAEHMQRNGWLPAPPAAPVPLGGGVALLMAALPLPLS
jgi:hypothetical protein